ncbi:hypothetical protein ANAEL_03565 [Anaerolineales bacterium]|nr:hypothetical protein ANAEL_03565 [Anaerolineales bacterium]
MAISDEWTEWHLTPGGWRPGSYETDSNSGQIAPPEDRVMTCIYRETMSGPSDRPSESVTEEWRTDNAAVLQALLDKFGPCPRGIRSVS